MKQVLLCVALIVFAAKSTTAQDKEFENALIFTSSQATQNEDSPVQPQPRLQGRIVAGSNSSWNLLAKPIDRGASPFIVFVDRAPFFGPVANHKQPVETQAGTNDQGFGWSTAIKQSLIFLGVQHGYALTQPKTRRDLKGPFFRDYLTSVKSLHGWEDGGKFFTNYIAHPMQGSLLGFIQIQNDPKGINLRYNESGAYWRSRLKALAWSAAWSTQFEIGPISQASIGNVGLHGKQTYVDIVMTPTAGIGLLILEDFLDQKLIRSIERNSSSYYVKVAIRTFLNPTRSVANLLRFKVPWYRDEALRSEAGAFNGPSNFRTRSPGYESR